MEAMSGLAVLPETVAARMNVVPTPNKDPKCALCVHAYTGYPEENGIK
jgi:hypothetical protein